MSAHYQVSGASAASISASIESGVLRGDWIAGAALPAVRVLADQLHVSPATVAKAYQELRQRGVVETEGRRGTRIRSRPSIAGPRAALRLPLLPGLRDLSDGEPDVHRLPSLGPALRAIAESVDHPPGYASAVAMPALTDAARLRLATDGVPVERATIAATSGTLDAMERLLTAHLRPGDAVAVEDPGWANLLDLLAACGLRPVPFSVDDDGPDPVTLSEALRAGARAVIITARAQNPTGGALTAERAFEVRGILAEHPSVLLIEDDHAAELAEVPLHCLGPVTDSWAFVRSASKPFGPDLRIALVAGDETTIARVVGRMRIGTGWVSTVLQRTLLHLWQDEQVTALIAEASRAYLQRRRALCEALAARGLTATGKTGINVWVPVPDETRAVGLLRDRGYAVAPGSLFRVAAPPGIRVTISSLDESEIPAVADAVASAVHPSGLGVPSR
ncbi:aminotransferase class I/II-fold pyridoxal phosphate-dependent enzyme [Actinoplanes sp. NPDC051343]|uniref:aminotransferase class I/II-fold pyridoxal phosphate-dependent enzyme n=1 Tax=Actinoplanes sp. NPDC051343 TaxID=3363906 RepID=UPI0037A47C03